MLIFFRFAPHFHRNFQPTKWRKEKNTKKKKKTQRLYNEKVNTLQKIDRVAETTLMRLHPTLKHSLNTNTPNKTNELSPEDCELTETLQMLKTVAEIEKLLKTTLPKFPTEVITQIALYAEFVQVTCWLCNKTYLEHFNKEYEIFTIYRNGWPPKVRNCKKCHKIWYGWQRTPWLIRNLLRNWIPTHCPYKKPKLTPPLFADCYNFWASHLLRNFLEKMVWNISPILSLRDSYLT